jgi:hypothetical protein
VFYIGPVVLKEDSFLTFTTEGRRRTPIDDEKLTNMHILKFTV